MNYEYCSAYHYDQSSIDSTLSLLELKQQDNHLGKILQDSIIRPNLKTIVDTFYEQYLFKHNVFKKIIGDKDRIPNLKRSQAKYLTSLGVDFHTLDYFENRLRVGAAHHRVGLTLSLYNFAYRKLRELILSHLPNTNNAEQEQLRAFIDRVIALDMSLAIVSYHKGSQTTLESSVTHLKEVQSILEIKANTDALTHFSTREATLSLLEKALLDSQQDNKPIIVMMIDIDNLGGINDQYGHLVGDHVMREIARRIQKPVPPMDKIGRYGGDEFIIILKSLTLSQAMSLAEQVLSAINTPSVLLKGTDIPVTASIGVCESKPDDSMAELIQKADRAMFTAKKAGGNRVMTSQK